MTPTKKPLKSSDSEVTSTPINKLDMGGSRTIGDKVFKGRAERSVPPFSPEGGKPSPTIKRYFECAACGAIFQSEEEEPEHKCMQVIE